MNGWWVVALLVWLFVVTPLCGVVLGLGIRLADRGGRRDRHTDAAARDADAL